MARTYGYVRVSAKDQNPDRQLVKMKSLGIEEQFIFIDKASGKDFDRPQYQNLRRFIQDGDLIYIDALDRLGRNYDEVISEWKHITRKLNADIVILENETLFDSRKFKIMGDMGKLMEDQFLSLLAYVAEQERKKIRQRQREGIDKALEDGRAYGRPKTIVVTDGFIQVYKRWKAREITAVRAQELLDMKPATFYRLAKEYEATAAGE
ncbi:Site-specific recombinase, DNA invertase Pin [uncultured Sporomusa sp.]|uniref:Site-specific recombinase, DNA invertase Pin n=1 Tax=uncultured Sporomusa sp. TaxID=307249 RepID=A0A212M1V2_9FIRM|nr:recombinase family protein [uncultured Sporomusa sp.]SCM83745.1 Site-specific recombinase, DNA invertase Pin [uncultured Sporomusa sp.]